MHGNVTSIGSYAFYNCISLQNITIPHKVTIIDNDLFGGCNKLASNEILGNITSILRDPFHFCGSLNYIFYNGEIIPSYQSNVFYNSPAKVVYVTSKYKNNTFCELPVMLLPTTIFSMSEVFTYSNLFSISYEFTKSNEFSANFEFTKSSKFSPSNSFTKSKQFNTNHDHTETNFGDEFITSFEKQTSSYYDQTDSKDECSSETSIEDVSSYSSRIKNSVTLSSSFSLTFVRMRSVSFSILNSISNSFYITFDNIKQSFIILTTQSEYFYNFPYIIYFYSPKYVSTNVFINIQQQKGLTGEKLIGIVCGSTSIFFIILFLIITVIRRKRHIMAENEISYSISSTSEAHIEKIPNENEQSMMKGFNESNNTDDTDDSDIDFWI